MAYFPEISAVLGIAAVIISILVGYGTLKARVKEPDEKRWEKLNIWKSLVDDKLSRDYVSLNRIDKIMVRRNRFEVVMLHGIKGILEHLAEGNHTERMRQLSNEIDKYLIDLTNFDEDRADIGAG
jgi:hypothetical protein